MVNSLGHSRPCVTHPRHLCFQIGRVSTHNAVSTSTLYLKYSLYTNIDQTLVTSLHLLLNCEISGLQHFITTEYRTHVHCIYMYTYFVMH